MNDCGSVPCGVGLVRFTLETLFRASSSGRFFLLAASRHKNYLFESPTNYTMALSGIGPQDRTFQPTIVVGFFFAHATQLIAHRTKVEGQTGSDPIRLHWRFLPWKPTWH